MSGESEVDVAFLKSQTRYEGFAGPDDVIVARFWRVFGTLSNHDRAQYVRFAWGRARLPPRGSKWTNKHCLTRSSASEDKLPVAHTCFFSLELPLYSTDDILRKRLLTAIHYGVGGILNS